MLYGILGLAIIVIIVLIIRLNKKQTIDKTELASYNNEISQLKTQKATLSIELDGYQRNITAAKVNLQEVRNDLSQTQYEYNNAVKRKLEDLDTYFKEQRAEREAILTRDLDALKESMTIAAKQKELECEQIIENANQLMESAIEKSKANIAAFQSEEEAARTRYESLIAPIKQYEMERQQRLFYTIQVPDEYKEDIDFLLTTVSQKVQHPDIVNKLVWNEYVKPYIDDTFRRVGIEDKSGIYKITNLDNGKAYIGKSTNIKKRLADHFKSSIGISSIADQAVHHEILRTGFWNWTLEPIIYCNKDKLNEMEKYYINFFDTVNNGYNKNSGGGG